MNPQYLGDGVYIRHNLQIRQFVLTTGSHELGDADAIIYLEHEVAALLIQYLKNTLNPNEPTI